MKWFEFPEPTRIYLVRVFFAIRLWFRFPNKEERKTIRRESLQWADELWENAKRKEEWLAAQEKRPLKSSRRLSKELLEAIRRGKV